MSLDLGTLSGQEIAVAIRSGKTDVASVVAHLANRLLPAEQFGALLASSAIPPEYFGAVILAQSALQAKKPAASKLSPVRISITPKRSEMEQALRTLEQSDDRLFIGVYPCAIVYADRWIQADGDYERIATLPYRELELECSTRLHPLVPKIQAHAATIMAQRGRPFSISGSGQTVILGQ